MDTSRNKSSEESFESLEVLRLIQRVSCWFETEEATWHWYNHKQLQAFARLTPRQVVERYHKKGIIELNEWVTERNSGGFQ